MNLQLVYRYILSFKKMKIYFTKKTQNKTKGPKKKERKFPSARVVARTIEV